MPKSLRPQKPPTKTVGDESHRFELVAFDANAMYYDDERGYQGSSRVIAVSPGIRGLLPEASQVESSYSQTIYVIREVQAAKQKITFIPPGGLIPAEFETTHDRNARMTWQDHLFHVLEVRGRAVEAGNADVIRDIVVDPIRETARFVFRLLAAPGEGFASAFLNCGDSAVRVRAHLPADRGDWIAGDPVSFTVRTYDTNDDRGLKLHGDARRDPYVIFGGTLFSTRGHYHVLSDFTADAEPVGTAFPAAFGAGYRVFTEVQPAIGQAQ